LFVSGTPAIAGIAIAKSATDAMTTKETFHLSGIFILRAEGKAPDLGLSEPSASACPGRSAAIRTRSADR